MAGYFKVAYSFVIVNFASKPGVFDAMGQYDVFNNYANNYNINYDENYLNIGDSELENDFVKYEYFDKDGKKTYENSAIFGNPADKFVFANERGYRDPLYMEHGSPF